MIDITGVDLKEFAKEVYRLSIPRGLGRLHFVAGELSDEDAAACIVNGNLHMDYVHGRGCKMNVMKNGFGRSMAPSSWYDHDDVDYENLLAKFGFSLEYKAQHSGACECSACVAKRTLARV